VTGSAWIAYAKIRDVYEFQYAGATELGHMWEPDKRGHNKGRDGQQSAHRNASKSSW